MTTFQLYSALTRTKQALTARASPARVAVLERSLYSGRFCFGEMARQQVVGVLAKHSTSHFDVIYL